MRQYRATLAALFLLPLTGFGACEDAEAWTNSSSDSYWSGGDAGSAGGGGAAECAPLEQLRCGDYVWGDSADPNSGHTTVIDHYPVAPGNFSGPEIAWEFVADHSGEVTWRLDHPSPTEVDHDLFVLAGDACRADHALVRGHNDVTFYADAGERYFLLIDGYDGDAGLFDAQVRCEGDDGSGEPAPDLPADPCAGLQGAWATDDLQPVARCTQLLDGAVADSGWFGSDPEFPLAGASLCLARGEWGLNGHGYYVLGGQIAPLSSSLPSDINVYGITFLGEDGGNRAYESGVGVDLRNEDLGSPVIDSGDVVTEVRWDAGDDTLLYRQRHDGWGVGDEELVFSALLDCSAGGG